MEQKMDKIEWRGRLAHILRGEMGNSLPEFWRKAREFWDEAYKKGMTPYEAFGEARRRF